MRGQVAGVVVLMACGGGGSGEMSGFAYEPDADGRPFVDVSDRLEPVLRRVDRLQRATDLAFNPEVADELWVMDRDDDAAFIVSDASTEQRSFQRIKDPAANHFMEEVVAIAFGAPGTFATCGDSRNTYDDRAEPNDFMGPALWSSDLEIFGETNPEAVDFLGFDLGSHLDMLHESPLCMGIAWEQDNVYWTFDGLTGSVSRYDFQEDHGVGYDDHDDGIIRRYGSDDVVRVEGSVAHMDYDPDSAMLYISDAGNGRIAVLDTTTGTEGQTLRGKEPAVDFALMDDVQFTTWVDGADVGLEQPAGLERIDDHIVVTDGADGEILVFDMDGVLQLVLATGLDNQRLAGITGFTLDDLWIADQRGRVLRIRGDAAAAR